MAREYIQSIKNEYGKRKTTKRICLKCEMLFPSKDKGNRICQKCKNTQILDYDTVIYNAVVKHVGEPNFF